MISQQNIFVKHFFEKIKKIFKGYNLHTFYIAVFVSFSLL